MAERMTLDEALKLEIEAHYSELFRHDNTKVEIDNEGARIGTFSVPKETNIYETLKSLRRKLKNFVSRYDM